MACPPCLECCVGDIFKTVFRFFGGCDRRLELLIAEQVGPLPRLLPAINVNSRLGEAHNNLAALYAMTGRKGEAQESVKQAEKSGYQVNPKLKSDIQALPKEPS